MFRRPEQSEQYLSTPGGVGGDFSQTRVVWECMRAAVLNYALQATHTTQTT